MADKASPPKGWLIAGFILLALSLASCGAGGFACSRFISDLGNAASESGSSAFGEQSTFTASSDTGGLVLSTSANPDCVGEDSKGNPISFNDPGTTSGSVSSGETTYDLAYGFDTVAGETYNIVCDGPSGGSSGRYLVITVPSFGAVGLGVSGIFGGAFMALLGVIFLIVGLVRRSSWKKRNAQGVPPAGGYGVPPAGGYAPPPGQPGAMPPPAAPPPPAPPVAPPPAPPTAPPPPAPPTAPPPPS